MRNHYFTCDYPMLLKYELQTPIKNTFAITFISLKRKFMKNRVINFQFLGIGL